MVVSQPDRRRGRGSSLSPSPVKQAAARLGLPVTERVDDLLTAGAELGVVVAYGRLVRPHVLAALPMVNLHFSLLPRWRGAAPVERAILAGDRESGVCLMALEEGLDTGPVYDTRSVAVGPEETAAELRDRLVAIGTEMIVGRLAGGVAGLGTPSPQEGEATYAAKIDPAELEIDWARPAEVVHRLVRLGTAWTVFRGERLHILRAHLPGDDADPGGAAGEVARRDGRTRARAGDDWLELVEVKPQGKGPMAAGAWLNGARLQPGERLGA